MDSIRDIFSSRDLDGLEYPLHLDMFIVMLPTTKEDVIGDLYHYLSATTMLEVSGDLRGRDKALSIMKHLYYRYIIITKMNGPLAQAYVTVYEQHLPLMKYSPPGYVKPWLVKEAPKFTVVYEYEDTCDEVFEECENFEVSSLDGHSAVECVCSASPLAQCCASEMKIEVPLVVKNSDVSRSVDADCVIRDIPPSNVVELSDTHDQIGLVNDERKNHQMWSPCFVDLRQEKDLRSSDQCDSTSVVFKYEGELSDWLQACVRDGLPIHAINDIPSTDLTVIGCSGPTFSRRWALLHYLDGSAIYVGNNYIAIHHLYQRGGLPPSLFECALRSILVSKVVTGPVLSQFRTRW